MGGTIGKVPILVPYIIILKNCVYCKIGYGFTSKSKKQSVIISNKYE